MKRVIELLAVAAVLGLGLSMVVFASGTSGPSMQSGNSEDHSGFEKAQEIMGLYQQGIQAGKDQDYPKAIGLFEQALQKDPANADVLNMLAHAQRMTGQIDAALANYQKALAIRPDFPEAREYLGETYLQAALGERDKLKSYGDSGKEQMGYLDQAFQAALDSVKGLKKVGDGTGFYSSDGVK
ncbi:MAG TPA: tetratricopeptide repeat protein [bacterium]|jgi:tetratricopeptide (TPR) repeat protein|nr:tetratricopeptide repeat protein [bacterium]